MPSYKIFCQIEIVSKKIHIKKKNPYPENRKQLDLGGLGVKKVNNHRLRSRIKGRNVNIHFLIMHITSYIS